MTDPLETLRAYQKWRRGGEGQTLDPVEIGKAIDAVIAEVLRLRQVEKSAKNLVAQKGRHNTEISYKRLVEVLAS